MNVPSAVTRNKKGLKLTDAPFIAALVSAALLLPLLAWTALAQSSGITITDGPSVISATDSAAVITWRTDVMSTTVVDFGTTEALGQTYRKIVPMEETETIETAHGMTLWQLEPSTKYFYRVTSVSEAGSTAKSGVSTFTTAAAPAAATTPAPTTPPTPACDKDEWTCNVWSACSMAGKQVRTCELKTDCAGVETPKPALEQSCTPPEPVCDNDEWSCGAWSACSADGKQARVCTLKTDCSGVETPKPAVQQSCTPPAPVSVTPKEEPKIEPPPVETTAPVKPVVTDVPTQGANQTGSEPPDTTPPAPSAGNNSGSASQPATDTTGTAGVGQATPGATTASTDAAGSSPGAADIQKRLEDIAVSAGLASAPTGGSGIAPTGASSQAALSPEEQVCHDNGINLDRCAAWLAVRFADKSCAAAGYTTRESCEQFLTDSNRGIFPGCENQTADECARIKNLTTIGYLPAEKKTEIDALIGQAATTGVALAVPGVTAVSSAATGEYTWRASTATTGSETSPAVLVSDSDHNGVPDDLETILAANGAAAHSATATALASGHALGQPRGSGTVDQGFSVSFASENPQGNAGGTSTGGVAPPTNQPPTGEQPHLSGTVIHGTCEPNATCLLYVYSYVPLVLATATDENGNWTYDLGDQLADGEHTVYVAVTDETGNVVKKSNPLSLFVQAAQAVTIADYLRPDIAIQNSAIEQKQAYYLWGVAALIAVAAAAAWVIMRRANSMGREKL